MLLFLLLVFPVSLVLYFAFFKNPKDIIPAVTGLSAAVIYCGCKAIFTFSHRLVSLSFAGNFSHLLLSESFLPAAVLFGVFFLVSKDTVEYKIRSFFPLLAAFYLVFLPYVIISASDSVYSAYDLFVKPVVYLAYIVQAALNCWYSYKCFTEKRKLFGILNIFIALIYSVLPAVFQSLYYVKEGTVLNVIITIIYCLVPLFYVVYKFFAGGLKENSSEKSE